MRGIDVCGTIRFMHLLLALGIALFGVNAFLGAFLDVPGSIPPSTSFIKAREIRHSTSSLTQIATSAPPVATSTLLFVGDIMFDRYIRSRANILGYDKILEDVCSTTNSVELTVGNLEGPVTSMKSVTNYLQDGPNHYTFTFASTSLDALHACGFDALSLGNNHSMNFGIAGLDETRAFMKSKKLLHFGDPENPYQPALASTSAGLVALYAYNEFGEDDANVLTQRLRTEATSTFVVVMPHWGEEYDTKANTRERTLARVWVDAGADLVVGAHPHVIQDSEVYQGVPIFYSLGNFVFDQYFSNDVRCGLLLKVEFSSQGTVTESSFIELSRDGRTLTSTCGTSTPKVSTSS